MIRLSLTQRPRLKVYDATEARQHLPPPRTVVDLHIEKLIDDWHGLSNGEILNIQLKEFEKWYELSVAHRQSHLIVIHGNHHAIDLAAQRLART